MCTESGETITEVFDQIVLSVGMEINPDVVSLANQLDVDLTAGNFCQTNSFEPVSTSREGIYVCGAFQGPKDIPQSVIDASAAAAVAGENLSLCKKYPYPGKGDCSRDQCCRRTAAYRRIRLQMRHQHRRRGQCAFGCGVCGNPSLCGICNR